MYMREKTRIRLHQNEIPKERGNIIQRQKEREGEESKIISNQNGTHKTYYIYIYIYTYVCMYVCIISRSCTTTAVYRTVSVASSHFALGASHSLSLPNISS